MIKIFAGIISVLLLVVSPKMFMFTAVGLAPAIVAFIVDVRPGKNTFQTVLFFNLAGVATKFTDFLNSPLNAGTFSEMITPVNLMTMYVFAAIGYFVVWLVPKVVVIIVDYKNERHALRIRERISQLIEEWGPEVKGR